MNKPFKYTIFVISLLFSSLALAQEDAAKPVSKWGGEAEVGILMTRGNTHTDTQNIKLGVKYTTGAWEHKFKVESLRTVDNSNVTADSRSADFRSTYQFSAFDYAYGSLRYEKDTFSGYDQRTTENIGYGRKLYNEKMFLWDVEAGVGGRQTDYTDNTKDNEGIVRLATNAEWKFSKTSSIKEELSVEHGSINTLTKSTTSLKVKMNSSLAMKLSLKVEDNSSVPPTKKHTDTQTALTLVYDL